jgi:hypothetical protein
MITAYGDPETKRKALEGGAEALFFTKPIDFGMLADSTQFVSAFRQGLKEAGFIEGQNVATEYLCGQSIWSAASTGGRID